MERPRFKLKTRPIFLMTLALFLMLAVVIPGGVCLEQEIESQLPDLVQVHWIPYEDFDPEKLPDASMMIPFFELIDLFSQIKSTEDRVRSRSAAPSILISEANYQGVLEGDILSLKGVLTVRTFHPGWAIITLNIGHAQPLGLLVSGTAWPVLSPKPGELIVPVQGPSEHKVEIDLEIPVRRATKASLLDLDLPRASTTSLNIQLPPSTQLAAAELPGGHPLASIDFSEGKIQGHLPPVGAVRLVLSGTDEASEDPLSFTVQSQGVVTIEGGAIASRFDLSCKNPGPSGKIRIELPETTNVKEIRGAGITGTTERIVNGGLELEVSFSSPSNHQHLTLQTEDSLLPLPSAAKIPVPVLPDAKRHTGNLQVHLGDGNLGRPETRTETGVLLRSVSRTKNQMTLDYRVIRQPIHILLHLSRREGRLEANFEAQHFIDEATIQTSLQLSLTSKNRPLHRVSLPLQETTIVESVTCPNKDQVIEWRTLGPESDRILEVEFKPPVAASPTVVTTTQILVSLRSRIPTIPGNVVLEAFVPRNANSVAGKIVVTAEPALRITERSTLAAIRVSPVPQVPINASRTEALPRDNIPGLAYLVNDQSYSVSLDLSKRTPRVSAQVNISHTPSPQSLQTTANLVYLVEQGTQDRFRFRIPPGYTQHVEAVLVTPGDQAIKEKFSDGRKSEWTLTLQKKVTGPVHFRVSFDHTIPAEAAGSGEGIAIRPHLQVLDVLAEDGTIAITAAENVEVHARTEELRETDLANIKALSGGPSLESLLFAYQYSIQPYDLELQLRVHEPGEVLICEIDEALFGVAVTETGSLRGKVKLTMKNAGQQYLGLSLPEASEHWSTLINDAPVKPLSADGSLLLIPIPISPAPSSTFTAEITYSTPIDPMNASGHMKVTLPRLDVPVLQTNVVLDLPGDFEYYDAQSPWEGNLLTSPRTPLLELLPRLLGDFIGARGTGAPSADSSVAFKAPPRAQEANELDSLLEKEEMEEELVDEDDGVFDLDKKTFDDQEKRPTPQSPPALSSARKAGILPMKIDFKQSGRIVRFTGYGDGGAATFDYVHRDQLRLRSLLWFFLGLALSLFLARTEWIPIKGQVLLLLPLFLLGPYLLSRGITAECNAAGLGVLLPILWTFLRWILIKLRNRFFFYKPEQLRKPLQRAMALFIASLTLVGTSGQASIPEEKLLSQTEEKEPSSPSSIYIPYEPSKGIPGASSTGPAFLSLDFYRRLLQRAHPEIHVPGRPDGLPQAVTTRGNYAATVVGDRAQITAQLDFFLFEDGWVEIPIHFNGAVVLSATLDGNPAKVKPESSGNGYVLLLNAKGSHRIRFELTHSFASDGNDRICKLAIPPCPTGVVSFRLQSEEWSPGLGVPTATQKRTTAPGGEVTVKAPLAGYRQLELRMDRGQNQNHGSRLFQSLEARVSITPDALELQTDFSLTPLGLNQSLAVDLPPGFQLTGVSGPPTNEPQVITSYRILDEQAGRSIRISFEGAKDEGPRFRLEGFVQRPLTSDFEVPILLVQNAGMRDGSLKIFSEDSTLVHATSLVGLEQSKISAGPRKDQSRRENLRFKIVSNNPTCNLRVQEDTASLRVDLLCLLDIHRLGQDLRVTAKLSNTGRASELQLHSFDLPPGFDLTSVSGSDVIDSWVESESTPARLFVQVVQKQASSFHILLQAPTSQSADETPLPLLLPTEDPDHLNGTLLIRTDPGVDVALSRTSDLFAVDVSELTGLLHQLTSLSRSTIAPKLLLDRLGVRFRKKPTGNLAISQLKPTLEADVATSGKFGEGWLTVHTTLRVRVTRGQVDKILLSVPNAVKNIVEIQGNISGYHAQGPDGPERTLFHVTLHSPESREIRLSVRARRGLGPGKITIPAILPRGVQGLTGTVQVIREMKEDLVISEITGLTEDAKASTPNNRVYRLGRKTTADNPWNLEVKRVQVTAEEILEAAIASMTLNTSVIDRNGDETGTLMTEVEIILENRSEQYLRMLLPENAELWSTFVDDRAEKPVVPSASSKDPGNTVWIPLRKSSPGETASTVRIVYVQQFKKALHKMGTMKPGAPKVIGIPISQTYWRFRLPEGRTIKVDGNMDPIDEAVALVDRLEQLYTQQLALRQVASTGSYEQRKRASSNLDSNVRAIRKNQLLAQNAQSRLERSAQRDDLKSDDYRQQAFSNRKRLESFEKQIEDELSMNQRQGNRSEGRTLERLGYVNGHTEKGKSKDAPGRSAPKRKAEEGRHPGGLKEAGEKKRQADNLPEEPSLRRSRGAADFAPDRSDTGAADDTLQRTRERGLLSLTIKAPPTRNKVLFKKLEGDPKLSINIEYDEPSHYSVWGAMLFFMLIALALMVARIRAMA